MEKTNTQTQNTKTPVNTVQLTGNLGRDAQMTNFESGKKKVQFTLATTDFFRNAKDELVTNTIWHNVVAWGPLAEKMASLIKGNKVTVRGSINNRSYQDKEGNTKYITEIIAKDFAKIEKVEEAPLPI